MEISAEKTKLMMHHTSGINTEIKVNGQRPETVTIFKYLGSVKTDEGSKPETLSRIAQMTAALTRLKLIGMTGALLSVARYTRWAHLSHPSSCTLVNHGPSQQSCKEEYCLGNEVLPQDTMHLIQSTMLPRRKSVPRSSSRKSDHTEAS